MQCPCCSRAWLSATPPLPPHPRKAPGTVGFVICLFCGQRDLLAAGKAPAATGWDLTLRPQLRGPPSAPQVLPSQSYASSPKERWPYSSPGMLEGAWILKVILNTNPYHCSLSSHSQALMPLFLNMTQICFLLLLSSPLPSSGLLGPPQQHLADFPDPQLQPHHHPQGMCACAHVQAHAHTHTAAKSNLY